MLELIEEDAGSFSQRAELYHKRRPQLVDMVEQLYRAQCSLAEQYDQLRSEVGRHRNPTPFYSLIPRSRMDKLRESSPDSFDSDRSEVDDPEEEVQVESKMTDEDGSSGEVKLMHEEIERLRGVNEMLKAELKAKDEEKREVIRQLSLPIGILTDENASLRKCIKKMVKGSFCKLKEIFFWK
ncbi:protein NETWORKED 3A [Cocos nucifera]|uniref:Protein NETWORKED 3A n=1 Tax=Cocos nucifera TaxID=13894 RepID=A0A8K0HUB3_COCNU|nr:protein NETWORKED 3A [Cocos nucifera]